VTIAIAPAIADAEQQRAIRKPPGNLDAWVAYQRRLWHMSKATAGDNALAQKFFQQAIDLDPAFAGGYWGLAAAHMHAAAVFQTSSLPDARSSMETLARRAVALDGSDAEARSWLGQTLFMFGDHKGALAESERALAMSQNLTIVHETLGIALIYSGRTKEGLAALQRYHRLDPRDPTLALGLLQIAIGHYFCREYETALEAAKRVIRSYPGFPLSYRWLAATLGQLGRTEEARDALEKAIVVAPTSFDFYVRGRAPWFRPEDHVHMLEGLRKARWEG